MTTIMQPFHCYLQPQIQETHRNNPSLQNTEEEPIRDRNDRSRNRRTHEVPFIAGCNHFTRKNTRFRAPASSPKQSPLSIHADITMRFFVATSLRHHFPKSPLPFLTTSLRHHFPSSPLPFLTTSQSHHHFPSSPISSSPLPCIAFYFFVMYCYTEPPFIAFYSCVMYCYTEPPFIALFFCDVLSPLHHPSSMSVSQFYLSVTRKIASQLPLII